MVVAHAQNARTIRRTKRQQPRQLGCCTHYALRHTSTQSRRYCASVAWCSGGQALCRSRSWNTCPPCLLTIAQLLLPCPPRWAAALCAGQCFFWHFARGRGIRAREVVKKSRSGGSKSATHTRSRIEHVPAVLHLLAVRALSHNSGHFVAAVARHQLVSSAIRRCIYGCKAARDGRADALLNGISCSDCNPRARN